ncbi:MAG TPA: protein phosphatase 2C domain-containing protein [Puia sp.]|nr:protein phosphatase 2C domain-containing protein [Puia sp.]
MNLTEIYYLHEIGGKKNNEDYIWPVPGTASPDDKIFIVCDGVGGSENGEIASKIVAQSVGTTLLKTAMQEIDTPFINQLLSDAKQKLIDYARQHQLSTNMATTFSLLVFIGERAFISWCGDSRVYHIRNGEILFKTDDHSLVSSLVKSGEITKEEAQTHPQKNMLLKAVNADEADPEAEGHWIEEVLDGDYFMLCTDGLLENIGDRDIKFLLEQNDRGSIDLVQSMQKFCYDKTRDNYSMYLVKVKTEEISISAKKKTPLRWWVLLLILVLAAAAFAIKEKYFMPQKVMNVVIPTNINKDSLDKADSLLHEKTALQENAASHDSLSPHSDTPVAKIVPIPPDSTAKHVKTIPKADSAGKHLKPIPKTDTSGSHIN